MSRSNKSNINQCNKLEVVQVFGCWGDEHHILCIAYHISYMLYYTLYIIYYILYIIYHILSYIIYHTSYIIYHILHIIYYISYYISDMIYDILHNIYDIFISSICISAIKYPPSTSLQQGMAAIYDSPKFPGLFCKKAL